MATTEVREAPQNTEDREDPLLKEGRVDPAEVRADQAMKEGRVDPNSRKLGTSENPRASTANVTTEDREKGGENSFLDVLAVLAQTEPR